MGVSKERLAWEYLQIPKEEREIIDRIKSARMSGFFWGERSSEINELNEIRKNLFFRSLKSIHQYLAQPQDYRINILSKILDGVEKSEQYQKSQIEKSQQELRELQEKNKRLAEEQIPKLTQMYYELDKARMLYGRDSEKFITINREIQEYSKNLAPQTSMALLNIVVNAGLKVGYELKNDPTTAKIVNDQWWAERMTIHDRQEVTCNRVAYTRPNEIWYKEYRAMISRSFKKDGQVIHVTGNIIFTAYYNKSSVSIAYSTSTSTERNKFEDGILVPKDTWVELPLNREGIIDFFSENLTTVFGDGATSKSFDALLNWYDENVGL